MTLILVLLLLAPAWLLYKGGALSCRTWCERDDLVGRHTEAWLRTLDQRPSEALAVARTRWNTFGDRAILELTDGSTLRIRCFWPRPVELARLHRARFNDRIGWGLQFLATNGDPTTLWAWSVQHQDATRSERR